jgi:hypothetical protein
MNAIFTAMAVTNISLVACTGVTLANGRKPWMAAVVLTSLFLGISAFFITLAHNVMGS